MFYTLGVRAWMVWSSCIVGSLYHAFYTNIGWAKNLDSVRPEPSTRTN